MWVSYVCLYPLTLHCVPTHPLGPAALQGDAKRLLLASLTKSLAEVLPFLERMLEANFAAAGAAAAGGNREAAQQHVLVIQAALQAVNTYSGGWAGEGGGRVVGWLGMQERSPSTGPVGAPSGGCLYIILARLPCCVLLPATSPCRVGASGQAEGCWAHCRLRLHAQHN
jgi:hypothetical protein